MKNKKLLSFAAIFPILLSSCGPNRFKVSMFFYNENDTFVGTLVDDLERGLKNSDYVYSTYFAKSSQNIQNEQIINEIKGKTDILVVNAVDRLSISAIIDKANSENLPVLLLNREPLKEDIENQDKVYFVGSDPKTEGIIQAQLIADLFVSPTNFAESKYDKNGDGKIQTVIIKGEQGHQDTEQRSIYCINEMERRGFNIEVIDSMFADWERAKSYINFKTLYEKHPDIELIFSNNDDMALGVIDYLKELKGYIPTKSITEQYFPIVGVDATQVGLTSVISEEMYGTVKNNGSKQVEVIMSLIDFILNNKDMKDFPYEFTENHTILIKGSGLIREDLIN